jgi:peptidoglycan biosynthesis protein MviN/MurJ (putative lipid II flippase)
MLAAISPRSLIVAASSGLAVKIALSAALVPSLGAVGLQVGTAAMYTVTAIVAWHSLRRSLRLEVAGKSLVQ